MPQKGIQIFHEQQVNVNPGPLGGLTALSLESAHNAGGLEDAFLMKKFRMCYSAESIEATDNVMLILARGNLSATEIGSALAINEDPEDDYAIAQATIRRIIDVVMVPNTGGATGTHSFGFTWDVDLPSKGMPFNEDEGWQTYIFNPSTSQWVAGSIHNAFSKIWGVYL